MNTSTHIITLTLLAVAVVLSAVAPTVVRAANTDTVFISNTAYSSVHTGGQSTNGADGEDGQVGQDGADGADGEDGQDGRDGTDGKTGVSISNTIGGERAAVHVESTVNGETVLDIHEDITNPVVDSAEAEPVAVVTATATMDTTDIVATAESDEVQPISTFARVKNAFVSLQLIIISYVSFIF